MTIRPSAQYANEKFKKPIKAVEIGVRSGENAEAMLEQMNIQVLVLVDPYLSYDDGGCYYDDIKQKRIMQEMLDRVLKYHNKIVLCFQKSENAIQFFPDNYFDYVYIDGNHAYNEVKKDLEWYKKIKKGGIISGHDYNSLVAWPGITDAVKEFAQEKKLKIIDCGASDWYIDLL